MRDKHREPDHSYRGHQRNCGHSGILAYGKTRLIGQLGNERNAHAPAPKTVAAPDTMNGPVPLRAIGVNEKIQGYQASGNANQSGEEDEPEIMLFGENFVYAQHRHLCLVRMVVPRRLRRIREIVQTMDGEPPPSSPFRRSLRKCGTRRLGFDVPDMQSLPCCPGKPPPGAIAGVNRFACNRGTANPRRLQGRKFNHHPVQICQEIEVCK